MILPFVMRGSARTRAARRRSQSALPRETYYTRSRWSLTFVLVPFNFLPFTKVFWKGEFEGKNLFFKKGFPLLIKLEKTSLKGSQLDGDRKFFQGPDGAAPSPRCRARRIITAPVGRLRLDDLY